VIAEPALITSSSGWTPAAKKVLEEAYKPNCHRKLQVTAPEVLVQILALQPPDPAAVLLGALGVNTSEVLHEISALALPDQTRQVDEAQTHNQESSQEGRGR